MTSVNRNRETVAMDVSNASLVFPYAQSEDGVCYSLPCCRLYGLLLVPAECQNEKDALICVSRKDPGVQVPEMTMPPVHEVPAIAPYSKNADGKVTVAVRIVLWPDSRARVKVNADCEMRIVLVSKDESLVETHDTVLKRRLERLRESTSKRTRMAE